MKKMKIRLPILLLYMFVACAIIIFGLVVEPHHPKIFFWGMLAFSAIEVVIELVPTLKDFIILVIGMVICTFFGINIDKLVYHFLGNNTLIRFIVSCVLLAPFYILLIIHLLRMCKKRLNSILEEDNIKK